MSSDLHLMSRAGKTFFFASWWLDRRTRADAGCAYRFCRMVDDIADCPEQGVNRDESLHAIEAAVVGADTRDPIVSSIVPLMERFSEIRAPFADIVRSCREDTSTLVINNEADLVRYAHGVAGNVGLIMYPMLGGLVADGRQYAADLGIAMQLTNIARDVIEDRARGRVYLPRTWLHGSDPLRMPDEQLLSDTSIVEAVRRVLGLADDLYTRGLSGLHYLAPKNRFAIRVAARCYAAIGERVIRNGALVSTRAVVPLSRKVALALRMRVSAASDGRQTVRTR
jgi:phytoene synthase